MQVSITSLDDENDLWRASSGTLMNSSSLVSASAPGETFLGGPNAETFTGGAGDDSISGGGGDDLIDGGDGVNQLEGGPGVNTLSFASVSSGVRLDLAAGTAQMETGSDTFTGFSVAIGSPWNDTLTASVGSTVYGGAGADSIIGAATGANFLRGDDGDDAILGGAGYNNVNGNKGDDTITGKSLVGDWLLGGQGNDQIDASASPGANILNGNIGADTILGGAGNDTLRGGQGDDLIRGGAGDDTFFGDLGNNTITGGAGADTFRNGNGVARDLITDFHQSEGDRVMIAANLTYTPPSQVGADVEIHVSNGDVLVLQNTLLTSLTSGWIVST